MSLREEMHSLVEGIVSASEMRRAGLCSLQRGIARRRHELHQARGAVAQGLRADSGEVRLGLAQWETRRRSEVQGWMGEIASDRGAAQREWRNVSVAPQQEKRVPEDQSLPSGQGHQGTRRRPGGKA